MVSVFDTRTPPRKVIVACMRNEALFVVEWVAHHLAMGFDRIIVFTNDCDDGTDALLDAMARFAPVARHDNPGPYDAGTIQKTALALAYGLPEVRGADWVLHIDADEYVNVEVGSRRIDDLLALYPDVDGIALMWRHFGSAGKRRWGGGSVIETFLRCEGTVPDVAAGQLANFKTLFRPDRFGMMSVHTPKMPLGGRVPRIVNTAGVEMPVDTLLTAGGSGYSAAPHQVTWDKASLHHHHVKSDDLHRMKHARGDANGRKNSKRRIGSTFYDYANRNDVRSKSLLRLRPRVIEIEAALRSDPTVREAEAQAMAWFVRNFRGGAEAEPESGATG